MFVAETHVGRRENGSRCSTKAVTMLHEEVILTNTPWRPGPLAVISSAPSLSAHMHTHTHTLSHTHTITSPPMPSIVLPPLYPTAVISRPASHADVALRSPSRRSCVTRRSVASSGEAKSLGELLLPSPPGV